MRQWAMRRRLIGLGVGTLGTLVSTLVLVALRSHVSVSTVTLIFIIPAIAAEVAGGILAGFSTMALSALVLDYYFIPPYGTLTIGSTQNWVGFGVYVVVVTLVAVVVANHKRARLQATRHALHVRRVYELSERLVQEQTSEDLLVAIVRAVQSVFNIVTVALFVLEGDQLRVAASVGPELSDDDIRQLHPQPGQSVSMSTALGSAHEMRTISLAAAGRPVGILVVKGSSFSADDRDVLVTFANDAALALERTQLREQALRTKYLEEVDRLRHALMGAVSHDLRTPLATIKVATSTLIGRGDHVSANDVHELLSLIDIEADRLTRLVTNLLDMTRIEAGVFEVHRVPTDLCQLLDEARRAVSPAHGGQRITIDVDDTIGVVDVDPVLIGQVLVNLLDNALRHSSEEGVIMVRVVREGDHVGIVVDDDGPGVAPGDREIVFNRFVQTDTGGRAGLGLTIARTFVLAHGGRIWCDEAPGGGARFAFTLAVAPTSPEGE